MNFQLRKRGFDLNYLDNLIPWEKTIYVSMVEQEIREENELIKQQMAASGVKREFV